MSFGPLFARELRRRRSRPTSRWHLDEMAVIDGKPFWLWRAVDSEGEVIDLLVQRRRNTTAAIKLMRKLLKKQGFAQDRMLWSRALAAGFARVVEKPLLENQLVDGIRGSCSSENIRERRVARHLRMST